MQYARTIIALIVLLCSLIAEAQTVRFVEHRVRWMENIYTISNKYGVEPKTILEYNGITAYQVRRGITLRIPILVKDEASVIQNDILRQTDPLDPFRNQYVYDCYEYRPSPRTMHRVSLILPFQLHDRQPNNQYLEFYEGLLLAVEDLKDEGMSIRLSSYDSGSYPRMSTLVQSGALQNEELVIGPVADDLFDVINYTYGQNSKIVSPLDPRTEPAAYANPNFFQVNTSLYWQQSNLISFLLKNAGMVWVISEDSDTDMELVSVTKDILRENRIIYREFIHKVSKTGDVTGELAQMFTQRQNNQVIVASSNEAFVSDILRNLYLVHTRRNCPVTLYGNAEWRNFVSVDLEYFHSMNLHLSVSNYVDYQKPETKRFLARFRALYRTEPSAYAYQGYDVGTFFLRALHTKGPSFEHCIEQGLIPSQPLQSNFRFEKINPEGGFVNTDTRIIRYLPDYRIEILH